MFKVNVFNVTSNTILVLAWRSVLKGEETGIFGEKVTDQLDQIMLYRLHLVISGFELVVIGTDCTSSCKYNHHTIKTTTDFFLLLTTY